MVCNPKTILIVDDDATICELVSEGLIEDGYTCDIASNADDALIKMQNHNFRLALLDIKLPGKSGIELLRSFQMLSPTTEIVMITATKDLDIVLQAMKSGASDYIVKPFTIDQISTSIRTILESSNKHSLVSHAIQKTTDRSLDTINAIAYGVDAQVDHFDFHSKIVTEKTIEYARRLGLPEEEIKKWTTKRNNYYLERNIYIETVLSKLERNPMAQMILGLTHSVYRSTNPGEKQN